jgi:pimeloyl-ACP methyl ester carboxylesterase
VADRRAEALGPFRAGAASKASRAAGDSEADEGRIVRVSAQDGLALAARIFDSPGERLPLLCLAGLSRNSRDFIGLGRHFAQHPEEPRSVFALDYRGRGLSDHDPNWRNYTPLVEAHDVLTAVAALGIEQAIVVGTSRGGIIAMLLGALRPGLLAGIVLNDIGPIVEGTGLARIKNYLKRRKPARDWAEAEALVREAVGSQFPSLSNDDWRAFAEATFTATSDGLVPQFDPKLLNIVEALDPTRRIPTLWPQFLSLGRVPALALRGEFSDLLSAATIAEMAARHPDFEHATVPGQGHAPHLRDPATLGLIQAFARRCEHSPCG